MALRINANAQLAVSAVPSNVTGDSSRSSQDTLSSSGEWISLKDIQAKPARLTHDGYSDFDFETSADESAPLIEEEDQVQAQTTEREAVQNESSGPVRWLELPRKDQLLILTLARLAEPIFQTSIQAYIVFMLKGFSPHLSDATISSQAGVLTASFTATQCLTAVWWGRLADKEWMGRKRVLLIGLAGSCFSSIGFGFAKSFWSAVLFRSIGGALNGNVGVMRVMISEIIKEKKFQPKAFLVMPLTANLGVLVGPLMGGTLQNPVESFPSTFGPGGRLGGSNGVGWMIDFPYALPNLINASLFLASMILIFFGLEETSVDRRNRRDLGLAIGKYFGRSIRRLLCLKQRETHVYDAVPLVTGHEAVRSVQSQDVANTARERKAEQRRAPKLPFRRMFTRNVVLTFITHGLSHLHISGFGVLWVLILSTPRTIRTSDPNSGSMFSGGLGLEPATIGTAIGIIGALGLCLQFGIYSRLTHRLGIVRTFRYFLGLTFPFVYLLAPLLVLVPPGLPKVMLWLPVCMLLFLQVLGRTFVLPIGQILVNNCSPHPSVLGTIHGFGQSVSTGARTVGPLVFSALFGLGLRLGNVGVAYWILSAEAILAAAASWLVREGDGHEIWLEGD